MNTRGFIVYGTRGEHVIRLDTYLAQAYSVSYTRTYEITHEHNRYNTWGVSSDQVPFMLQLMVTIFTALDPVLYLIFVYSSMSFVHWSSKISHPKDPPCHPSG